MEFHLTWCYQKYICKDVIEDDFKGVEIYDENNKFLCDAEDIYIPNAEDEDSCKTFINEIGLILTDYYDA